MIRSCASNAKSDAHPAAIDASDLDLTFAPLISARGRRRANQSAVQIVAAREHIGYCPVVKVQDWVLLVAQVVGTAGTLGAVWLAVVTVRKSAAQARSAEEGLRRDRRIDFQLGILRELGQVNLRPDGTDLAIGQLKLLAAMLPVDLVPIARVVAGLETTWAAGELRDKVADELKATERQDWESYPVWHRLQRDIERELVGAAEQLLGQRA